MPSSFQHDPSFTVAASNTTAGAAVKWVAAKNIGESLIILDSGGNGRIGLAGDLDLITLTANTVTVAGTVAATTVTGNHTSGAWTGTAVITTYGGTGLASYTAGDMFYYASGTTLTKLAKGTADQVLTMNDGATAPQWETAASASAFPYSSATVASIEATTSTHNDRIPSMYVTANDSGNMVDGFGPQSIFRATDSGATNSILGQMSFERSGADNSGKFRLQSKVAGADNTLMVIYPTGAMQLPDQPAFYAINASTDDNQTGNGPEFTLTFSDTETNCFDQGGNFSSNTFTAPVDGRYVFFAHMEIRGLSAAESLAQMRIKRNSGGTPYTQLDPKGAGYSSEMGMHLSSMMNLAANDTVTVTLVGTGESGNVWDINGQTATHTTAFSGFLVA